MAAITSKVVTGNLSTATNWVGDTAPVDGDTIIVVNGADINIDQNIALGSNSSAIGHAFTVQGASSSSYGVLRLGNVTLTLSGYNTTTNTLGIVNRYGRFISESGGTVQSLIGSDYKSIILNKGSIVSSGTTWQSHPNDVSWNHFGSAILSISIGALGLGKMFDDVSNQWICTFLLRIGISNSTGTGLGSFGDSSLSFVGATDSGGSILTNEVGSISAISTRGDYCVDYSNGVVYAFRFVLDDITAGTANYYCLMFNSWGIHIRDNNTYNSATFTGDTMRYMGSHNTSLGAGDGEGLVVYDKTTADSTRLFSLTNSTIEYCGRFLRLSNVDGISGSLIPITGNTIRWCEGAWPGGNTRPVISIIAGSSDYVDFSYNNLDIASDFALIYSFGTIGANVRNNGWVISHNTGKVAALLYGDFGINTSSQSWDNLHVHHNTLDSFGTANANFINHIGTTDSTKPVIIEDNDVLHFFRVISVGSNITFRRNHVRHPVHHGFHIGSSNKRYKLSGVRCYNNLFTGNYLDGGFAHLGYLNQLWIDDIEIYNNTFCGTTSTYSSSPAFSFYDLVDSGWTNLVTNVSIYNNITVNVPLAYKWRANDIATSRARLHIKRFDYNAMYSVGDDYLGFNGQMQPIQGGSNYNLSTTRNVTGIAIFNADYTLPESTARTISYDATAKTLTWGSGDAVSINMEAQNSGTVTSFTNNNLTTLINDTSRNWSSDNTTTSSPNAFWLHNETTNTVHGIVWRSSATQIEVVPVVSGIANGDVYKIYKSEIRLYDSPGSTGNYIDVGIVYGDLPTTSKSDTGITFTESVVTFDPEFINTTLSTFVALTPINMALAVLGESGTYIGAVKAIPAGKAMMAGM